MSINGILEVTKFKTHGGGMDASSVFLTVRKTSIPVLYHSRWALYTAAPDGGWGIEARNFEIWEYPENNNSGNCCRRRFVIENSNDKSNGGTFYINAEGNLGIGLTPEATLNILRGSGINGIACFRGTTRSSHFNYNANEDTYIRGGKSSSNGIINDDSGNVLIGKASQANTTHKLDGAGKIRANEIVVNTTGADFVFELGYKLRKLNELESFIMEHKHLLQK